MVRRLMRIIAYAIIFGVNLWALWYFHGFFNCAILAMLVFLPVISILLTRYVSKQVEITWDGPSDCMSRQEEFLIYLKASNPTFFGIPHCELQYDITNGFYQTGRRQELLIPLRAKKGQTVTLPITVDRCGRIEFRMQQIYIEDYFGFARFRIPNEKAYSVVVLPEGKIDSDTDLNGYMQGMEEVEESTKKGSDFSEVQDVREYQPGDKMQNIHWKLSVKKDILMVKERVSMSSRQLFVMPELYDSDGLLEEVLDCTCGIIKRMMQEGQPVSMVWWSHVNEEFVIQKIDYREQLEDAFRLLYYDRIYDDPTLAGTMYRRVKGEDAHYLWVGSRSEVSESNKMMDYGTKAGVFYGIS